MDMHETTNGVWEVGQGSSIWKLSTYPDNFNIPDQVDDAVVSLTSSLTLNHVALVFESKKDKKGKKKVIGTTVVPFTIEYLLFSDKQQIGAFSFFHAGKIIDAEGTQRTARFEAVVIKDANPPYITLSYSWTQSLGSHTINDQGFFRVYGDGRTESDGMLGKMINHYIPLSGSQQKDKEESVDLQIGLENLWYRNTFNIHALKDLLLKYQADAKQVEVLIDEVWKAWKSQGSERVEISIPSSGLPNSTMSIGPSEGEGYLLVVAISAETLNHTNQVVLHALNGGDDCFYIQAGDNILLLDPTWEKNLLSTIIRFLHITKDGGSLGDVGHIKIIDNKAIELVRVNPRSQTESLVKAMSNIGARSLIPVDREILVPLNSQNGLSLVETISKKDFPMTFGLYSLSIDGEVAPAYFIKFDHWEAYSPELVKHLDRATLSRVTSGNLSAGRMKNERLNINVTGATQYAIEIESAIRTWNYKGKVLTLAIDYQ